MSSSTTLDAADRKRAAEEALAQEHMKLEESIREYERLKRSAVPADVKLDGALRLYGAVVAFFNRVERELRLDDLAGHSTNELWLDYQVTTAMNALEEVATLVPRIRRQVLKFGGDPGACRPNRAAFSEMQRLVAEKHPDDAADLRAAFAREELPTFGFDKPSSAVRPSAPTPHQSSLAISPDGGIRVDGSTSADIRNILTGAAIETSRSGSRTAPASASPSASLRVERQRGWFASWVSGTTMKAAGGILAAVGIAYFGISNCAPRNPTAATPADAEVRTADAPTDKEAGSP